MVTAGIICLVGSTSFCGFYLARLLEKRYQQLLVFQYAVQLFETELTFSHTPLPEALRLVAAQSEKPIAILFQQFSEMLFNPDIEVEQAWRQVLNENRAYLALHTSDYAVLTRFAEGLGKHDLYTEKKQLENFQIHLQMQCEKAKEKMEKENRMTRSLGVLIGLLLVIILV